MRADLLFLNYRAMIFRECNYDQIYEKDQNEPNQD
jgi:hypothetical protein